MEIRSLKLALVFIMRLSAYAVNKLCSSLARSNNFVSASQIRLLNIDIPCSVDADTASFQPSLSQSVSV